MQLSQCVQLMNVIIVVYEPLLALSQIKIGVSCTYHSHPKRAHIKE